MRTYIIGNDGVALCRKAPAKVSDGEIVVTSKEELHAARSTASSFWPCGTRCPVSIKGGRWATARR